MAKDNSNTPGTLHAGEPHPSAFDAREWLASLPLTTLMLYQSSYSSCAIEGNRLGEVCSETLSRVLDGKPVSDRYLLGLAWSIRSLEESNKKD